MVVGDAYPAFIDCPTQNYMGQRIACSAYFIATEYEMVGVLPGIYRVKHYGIIAAGWVFLPVRHVKAADSQAVVSWTIWSRSSLVRAAWGDRAYSCLISSGVGSCFKNVKLMVVRSFFL